ncbi:MAG TPA: molybdate ABC transporter substrate-binding protein [Nitrospiraceae bacterium]|nr:molybdate ABC transporter substrate-binding protein [Nitrospiraceae bacterium]
MRRIDRRLFFASAIALEMMLVLAPEGVSLAKETLIIAASPSLKAPLESLGHAFEAANPDVQIRLFYDSGLGLRQTIAGMQNKGKHFIETGPFHLVAPGGDELIDRLEMKYYVLPGTRRAYVSVPLVLIAPASWVDAPTSFDALAKDPKLRVAIADPAVTDLGKQTDQLLQGMGIRQALKGRLDVAHDSHGVLDHLLRGEADVGILFGPAAAQERERVRIVAVAPKIGYRPAVHSMAMERYCPNRKLCAEFLNFIQSPDAQTALKPLGYLPPYGNERVSPPR